MDEQNQIPSPSDGDDQTPENAGSTVSRRALLRGGAAASPILLTLASGPVAATTNCQVASSFVSASVYKSRSPGSNNIKCVTKTATEWCNEAKNYSQSYCTWNPHNKPISDYVAGTVTSASFSWTAATQCYWAFRNGGVGLSSGSNSTTNHAYDRAVLQRLLALSHGAPTVFTRDYCRRIWEARSNTSLMASLVNDGGNSWDQTRLLTWLDYSANGITF
jgi:hypothetical protein